MASHCDRCLKGNQRGKNIARARQGLNYRSSRIFKPNLHVFRVMIGTRKVKLNLCTKCLRIVKKEESDKAEALKMARAKSLIDISKKKIVKKTKVTVKKAPVKSRKEKKADKAKKEAVKIAKLKAKEEKRTARKTKTSK